MRRPIAVVGLISFALVTCRASMADQAIVISNYNAGTVQEVVNGSVTNTESGFVHPEQFSFGQSTGLWVVDSGTNGIYHVVQGNTPSLIATDSSTPMGIVYDGTNTNHYIANTDGTVDVLTAGGTLSLFASGLSNPNALAIDASGNLYATVTGGVDKIDTSGNVTHMITGIGNPYGIVVWHSSIFISNGTLFSGYNESGTLLGSLTGFASSLNGLTVDTAGDVFASSVSGSAIYELVPSGNTYTISTWATGLSGGVYELLSDAPPAVPEPAVTGLLGGLAVLGTVFAWKQGRRTKAANHPPLGGMSREEVAA
jgi:hypothetical protein